MADVDLLIKLFDTLKDSSKDTQVMCQAMLTNQTNIGNYIRNLPLEELKNLIKDHAKTSEDDIESCTETVQTKSDNILKEVNTLKGKVKTMITVVIVAFSLVTVAVLIGGIISRQKAETYSTEQIDHDHEELKKEIIELIRKEFRKQNVKEAKSKNP